MMEVTKFLLVLSVTYIGVIQSVKAREIIYDEDSLSSVAYLYHCTTSWELKCGSTLISDRFAVTLRRCTLEDEAGLQIPPDNLQLRYGHRGDDTMPPFTEYRTIFRIDTVGHFALLELNGRIQFTEAVKPVFLADSDVSTDDSMFMKGYRMYVVDSEECQLDARDKSLFCGKHARDRFFCKASVGDGLLIRRNDSLQLAGIVEMSVPSEICDSDSRVVFRRLFEHSAQINRIMNDSTEFVSENVIQDCGSKSTKFSWAVPILWSYRNSKGWRVLSMAAVVSPRYVLSIVRAPRFITFEYRVALSEAAETFYLNFPDVPFRTVILEDCISHPDNLKLTENYGLMLYRLDRDIVFDENIQPICLPSLEDASSITPDSLIGYKIHGGSLEQNASKIEKNRECTSRRLKSDMYCVRYGADKVHRGSPVGYYLHQNGTQRFVLLGFVASNQFYLKNSDAVISIENFLPWIKNNTNVSNV